MRAALGSTRVAVGDGEAHMVVTVRAPERAERRRPPLHLAIVIDRSGSMAGDKLAQAKRAARQLVERLDERDRVAVVAYGSQPALLTPAEPATPRHVAAALAAIDRLVDDGGTNLSGGLVTGRDELLPWRSATAVSRVVLISDGLANEGITAPDELAQLARSTAERGVSITTVGVGLDFDEQTMTAIAVAGAGHYYFAEHADALADIFDAELARVGETVATDVRVAITPAPGVDVVDAYGYDIARDGRTARIAIADVHAGETRKVVVRLRVRADRPGHVDVAAVRVAYRAVSDGHSRTADASATAIATADPRDILDHADRDAMLLIERARTAAALRDATDRYSRGDREGALDVLRARKAEVKQIAKSLAFKELDKDVAAATDEAAAEFSRGSDRFGASGARAKKRIRKRAYDLTY
ncbi:MAG: VWA domain-containing protein [Deltaproteobacteria bacterium]|nr:MAG: VWA domain-containing protein [Deltaproteobacteria bacterium]